MFFLLSEAFIAGLLQIYVFSFCRWSQTWQCDMILIQSRKLRCPTFDANLKCFLLWVWMFLRGFVKNLNLTTMLNPWTPIAPQIQPASKRRSTGWVAESSRPDECGRVGQSTPFCLWAVGACCFVSVWLFRIVFLVFVRSVWHSHFSGKKPWSKGEAEGEIDEDEDDEEHEGKKSTTRILARLHSELYSWCVNDR